MENSVAAPATCTCMFRCRVRTSSVSAERGPAAAPPCRAGGWGGSWGADPAGGPAGGLVLDAAGAAPARSDMKRSVSVQRLGRRAEEGVGPWVLACVSVGPCFTLGSGAGMVAVGKGHAV